MFDVVIVGAGPAGTSCALWLKQLGFKPVLVDRHTQCGGLQLANPYTNTWIATSADAWGKDVASAMHANMLRHAVDLCLGQEAREASIVKEGFRVVLGDGQALVARQLVLAGGVEPKTGGFAQRLGMLVGPGPAVAQTAFEGTQVAILGGGDSAIENYHLAKVRGAKTAHIYARTLRAREQLLAKVDEADVHLGFYEVCPEQQMVNGRAYDHILVLYGFEANRRSLLGLDVALRPDGFIATTQDCETSMQGVYAIGEIAQRAHPCCATAMADGVVAAKAIQRRLEAGALARYTNSIRRMAAVMGKAVAL